MKNILVPVDFSLAARQAVRYAVDLARLYGSRITLLHVVAAPEMPGAAAAARKKLASFCECEETLPPLCTMSVRSGIPFFEITRAVNGSTPDLIVLGRPATVEFGNGQTLERVLRYATCPVLLVREDGRHFVPMPERESESLSSQVVK